MTDPERKIAALRGLIQVHWSDADTARVKRRVEQHKKRQLVMRLGGAAAVILCLCAAALRSWMRPPGAPRAPTVTAAGAEPAADPGHPLQLQDRSLAIPFGPADQLRLKEDGSFRTVVELVQGRARFDIVRRPERLFRVEAGGVAVEVLGTSFTVERTASRVTVAVEQGRVRVLWAGQQRELDAGRWQSFPPPPDPLPEGAVAAAKREVGTHAASAVSAQPAIAAAKESRSSLPATLAAPAGRERSLHPDARVLLRPAGSLLQEADAARLGPDPASAAGPLQELLRDHRADLRAPLAAFTLGKLQLEELKRPTEAARSFALARALDPDGPIAEDAQAREVEAWDKAGQPDRARLCAEEYLRRYPSGGRQILVRRHGHLP